MYVAEVDTLITGYIIWCEKNEFHNEVVLELLQVAVPQLQRGKGVGFELIVSSLKMVQKEIAERGAAIKTILITTKDEVQSQRLYEKALGAKIAERIPSLYSDTAIIMVANPAD